MQIYKITIHSFPTFVLAESIEGAISCSLDKFCEEYDYKFGWDIERVERIADEELTLNSNTGFSNNLILNEKDVCDWLLQRGYKIERKGE